MRFLAIDIDIRKPLVERMAGDDDLRAALQKQVWADVRRVRAALEALKLPAYLEDSGYKGCHVWVFFSEPVSAAHVRRFASGFVRRFGPASETLHWEIFPKQDAVAPDQLGNLIKIPLGIHRKSGRRALFVDADGAAYADQPAFLKGVRRVDRHGFRDAVARLAGREAGEAPAPLKLEELHQAFPQFRKILQGCKVVAALVQKAFATHHLTHPERHVLKCVFGHCTDRGHEFVHAVISNCMDYSRETTQHQLDRLMPSPIGCPRIRKHLPDLTASLPCCCDFDLPEGGYPSPVLYVDPEFTGGMSRTGGSEQGGLVDRYVELRRQAIEAVSLLERAEEAVRDLMRSRDTRSLVSGGWVLEEGEGGDLRIALKAL